MDDRKSLVLRGVAECVKEDELDALLSLKDNPKAYIGFEPSGLLHAGSLVPMLKCRELVEGCFQLFAQVLNLEQLVIWLSKKDIGKWFFEFLKSVV